MPSCFRPEGIYSAQWFPVDPAGELECASLAAHLAFEKRGGIHGVLALGSTGRFPQFSPEERRRILTVVAELAAPLPVIAHITDLNPRIAIELGVAARELGCAAVALMPPMFYPASQDDILAYFLHVADRVGLPMMLYNFPELAGKRIEPETVEAFADRAPMAAIKQSGGEFDYHRRLVEIARSKGFAVMTGADTRLPEAYALGVDGCTGGLVNIVPELMTHLDAVCRRRQAGVPDPAANRLAEVGDILGRLTFPLNVAAGIEARGLAAGASKSIVSPVSQAIYRRVVVDLRSRFEAWGLESPFHGTQGGIKDHHASDHFLAPRGDPVEFR